MCMRVLFMLFLLLKLLLGDVVVMVLSMVKFMEAWKVVCREHGGVPRAWCLCREHGVVAEGMVMLCLMLC